MDHFSKVLNERLKEATLTSISKKLNIPLTLLFEWKQAKRSPSFKNLHHVKKLADYFGMSMEELLFNEGGPCLISSVRFEDNKRQYRIKIERVK